MISQLVTLVGRSFRRSRGLLMSLAAVLAIFQVLVVVAASYLREQQGFSQVVALLPVIAQQFFGALLSSFTGMVAFGYWHPVVVIAFVGVAIVVASEPAADLESRVVDLVLARPVRRSLAITRSVVATALTTLMLVVLMVATSAISLGAVEGSAAVAPAVRMVTKLAANLVAVSWCLGALALAASTVLSRRGTAAGGTGVIAFASYLLNALADVSPKFKAFGPYSPFHYFQPMAIVAGGSRWQSDIGLLLVVAAMLCAVAYVAWSRRDL
ncbi:MAG: ABC transporter permease subunit [Acidobacteriota bacterium]